MLLGMLQLSSPPLAFVAEQSARALAPGPCLSCASLLFRAQAMGGQQDADDDDRFDYNKDPVSWFYQVCSGMNCAGTAPFGQPLRRHVDSVGTRS